MYIEYLISIILAFIVSFSATPVAKKIAFKIGAVDYPKDARRIHNKPIALFGGAAIITGFLITIFYNLIVETDIFIPDRRLWGLLAGVVIIVIMGIIDDIKHIGAKTKLLFQILAAITVVLISDTKISVFTNPFSEQGYIELSDYISYPLTILWIVGITNAINLIDGLDGLAAGVSSISSLSLFFVSVLGVSLEPGHNISILTAALAGATLGFLPFNFNPAKIFMGETGSAFLGFTLGVISIQGMLKSYATISIVIPLLVLGLPIFDTALAIIRRLINGKPVMTADRGHLHHKLIDMGLSQKQSVMILYLASAALGLGAIVLANKGALSAVILLITISAFVIGGARYMSEISNDVYEENNKDQKGSASNERLREKLIDKVDQNKNTSKIVIKDMKKLENP
ncbi:MAG TPA: undecaprenyl/decaprenyl-phosphate alpha-N-acetylglucosaminyl 1-phosphate transferase [Clostridiaceae bacterium]|nr:undecaprenyl/decaprenyl-phosphate alpha-N-acetylglucosaminyl 1-phosphate transferase [Clostridiaceae bacterium]